jgi:ribosome-associated protein
MKKAAKRAKPAKQVSQTQKLEQAIVAALEDGKAIEPVVLDVKQLCSFTDVMVVATGNTGRHVNALVDRVIEAARLIGERTIGVEGRETNEWVLVDFGDVVVHVMQKDARALYELEKLWSELPADSSPADALQVAPLP